MARCHMLDGIFLLKKVGLDEGLNYIGTRVADELPFGLGANPEQVVRDANGLWLVRTSDGQTKVAVPYSGYFIKKVRGENASDEVFYLEKDSSQCHDFCVIPEGGTVVAGFLETLGSFERPEDFKKKEERVTET